MPKTKGAKCKKEKYILKFNDKEYRCTSIAQAQEITGRSYATFYDLLHHRDRKKKITDVTFEPIIDI